MAFTFNCSGICPKCGAEHFTSSYLPAEFAPVTCVSCGAVTTVKVAINTFPVPEQPRKPDVGAKQGSEDPSGTR